MWRPANSPFSQATRRSPLYCFRLPLSLSSAMMPGNWLLNTGPISDLKWLYSSTQGPPSAFPLVRSESVYAIATSCHGNHISLE